MATTVFSHVRSRAGLHFVSGQTPLASDGEVSDSAADQTHVVLDKIEALLADVGADLADVMKVTYFLTRIEDLADVRAVLLDRLPTHRPRRRSSRSTT